MGSIDDIDNIDDIDDQHNATHHPESHSIRESSLKPHQYISTPNKSPQNQVNNFLDKFLCLVHLNVCLCLFCMLHVYIRYIHVNLPYSKCCLI